MQAQALIYVLKRFRPTRRKGICYLCSKETLVLIRHQGNDLLNQRNNLKVWAKKQIKPDHCVNSTRVRGFPLVQYMHI